MSPVQSMILAFERKFWARRDEKENAIREELALTPVRYYQLLNDLLDEPEALAADPVLVNRLRRIRSNRRPRTA